MQTLTDDPCTGLTKQMEFRKGAVPVLILAVTWRKSKPPGAIANFRRDPHPPSFISITKCPSACPCVLPAPCLSQHSWASCNFFSHTRYLCSRSIHSHMPMRPPCMRPTCLAQSLMRNLASCTACWVICTRPVTYLLASLTFHAALFLPLQACCWGPTEHRCSKT